MADPNMVIRGRGAPRFTFIHFISALASLDANKCMTKKQWLILMRESLVFGPTFRT